ncbi:prephenate dehydrogenase/arogenate dehydrogenase family protein [Bifidobacterium sp. ESL0775]|uniref:prephenate dehydrogenase n=1 Tax=Bifidobacterium sp. ESL0775 TaxID=2983230 RepID=UPI0023F9F6D3|nr:prephenate dehydrogenase/arogenate dehydrogenase family protein [Bifidobacterium sp. ESL0775]WEV69838.1 prephenate dehydrogenase/arogenate dehydrogenase family protein [Bifidobacterium sp. ESL0775]
MVRSVGIVGLGLIGGSLARRLVQREVEVVAWNHTERPYAAAREDGITCVDSLEDLAIARPEVLFLCNPLKAMPEMLQRLAPMLDREATTLSDVGSVKGMVRQQVEAAGLGDCYVGAHPMAGTEFSGFAASDPAIYDDALWAVTVDENTDYQRFLKVATLITGVIGNRVIVLDDTTHDRAAAMISHAPHVVSTAFINELSESQDRNIAAALAAGSWRDMTRVALTDPARTRAMIEEDADNVEALLRDLAARLTLFADDLHAHDDAALTQFFEAGQPFRDYKAHERELQNSEESSVINRPGDSQGSNDFNEPGGQNDAERKVVAIPETDWQRTFLDSARRGEHVVRFIQPWQVEVETRSKV